MLAINCLKFIKNFVDVFTLTSITSAAADELDTKRPYGTGTNITKQLLAIYMQRLEEEAIAERKRVEAEARAELTCIRCGKLSKDLKRTSGWITYVCDDCYVSKT